MLANAFIRRLCTVSSVIVALVLVISSAPLWLSVSALVGVVRRRRFIVLRLLCFLTAYLLAQVVGLLGVLRAYALHIGDKEGIDRAHFELQVAWGNALLNIAMRVFSIRLSVEGQSSVAPAPALYFMRHCSIVDTLLPVALISGRQGIQLRYVLKDELLVDPCLDIVGNRIPNVFVPRGKSELGPQLAAIAELAQDLGEDGVLIYPEGTRFSTEKRQRYIERARKSDPQKAAQAEALKHVLPPKSAGSLTLLRAAPHADAVFVAHRGLEGLATIADILSGALVDAHVDVRFWRVPANEIPTSQEEQETWLYAQWKILDDFCVTASQ